MASTCLYCGEELIGRTDKKFCDSSCRNGYNNQKNSDANKVMRNINNRLRKNRRILSDLLPDHEDTKKVQRSYLMKQGFDFSYYTHTYTTQKKNVYHYVYDYGYLQISEDWFLIVKQTD